MKSVAGRRLFDQPILQIVYQSLPAELIQVRPNGGNLSTKCWPGSLFYNELRKLKMSFAFPGDDRAGVLVNNHVRTRETLQNRLLYLLSH